MKRREIIGAMSLETGFGFNEVPASHNTSEYPEIMDFLIFTDCSRNDWKWLKKAVNAGRVCITAQNGSNWLELAGKGCIYLEVC